MSDEVVFIDEATVTIRIFSASAFVIDIAVDVAIFLFLEFSSAVIPDPQSPHVITLVNANSFCCERGSSI